MLSKASDGYPAAPSVQIASFAPCRTRRRVFISVCCSCAEQEEDEDNGPVKQMKDLSIADGQKVHIDLKVTPSAPPPPRPSRPHILVLPFFVFAGVFGESGHSYQCMCAPGCKALVMVLLFVVKAAVKRKM